MDQSASQIPPELLDQLHRATQHFHECKEQWERVLLGSDYRHEERVAAAQEELRQAEREVEEAEEKISRALASSPSSTTPTDNTQQ